MPSPAANPKKKASDPARYMKKARSILLYGPIEPKLTREVTSQLLLLDTMDATKPITLGAAPLLPGTTTMSSKRPIVAPSASSSGRRMTRKAYTNSPATWPGYWPGSWTSWTRK